jgi:hypothetical protein
VSDLVVTEAYFALHTHYGVPKARALQALSDLLRSGVVSGEPGGSAVDALRAAEFSPGRPGFADRLIHAQYLKHSSRLVTFERAGGKLGGTLVL